MAAPVAPAPARTSGRIVVALVLLLAGIVCLVIYTLLAAGLVKHHGAVAGGWLGAGLVLWASSLLVRLWP